MALPLPRHTAEARLKGQAHGSSVRGQLTPMTPQQLMSQYGIDSLKRPHLWLGNPGDKDKYQEGGRLFIEGREFSIENKQVFTVHLVADHVQLLVNEVRQ